MFKKKLHRRKWKQGDGGKNIPLKKFFFSLILAGIAYVGLITVERSLLEDYEHVTVMRVKQEIEENTEFTKENVEEYFYSDEIPIGLKSKNAITAYDAVIGRVSKVKLDEGDILSSTKLIKKNDILQNLIEPVEVSFEVSDLSQVVGGILRQGDLIDISVVSTINKTSNEVLRSAYIEKVFDTNGKRIEKSQKSESAVILNILIDSKEVKGFNEKISQGDVRVSKRKNFN